MDTTKAVDLFQRNWFLRDVETPDLADAEEQLITAAMGPEPKRWDGEPNIERMEQILAEQPNVLDRIGKLLIHVVVGMKGCGPAVTFLLDHDVPLEIDESAYNVLHEDRGGYVRYPQGRLRVGRGGRNVRLGAEAARRLAR